MMRGDIFYSRVKQGAKVITLCCVLFVGCKSNEPELNNPTSPTSRTNPSGADPGYSSVTATIAGPYTANGIDEIIVDVVMKDSQNRSLYQVTPGFDITNTDNKNIILCTPSNLAGESRCKIRSTRAEVKTIKLSFPFKKTLGTATFVHDVPAVIGIHTQPSTHAVAGAALPVQPVARVFDAYGNPAFSAVNPVTAGFYSNSTCTVASSGTTAATTNPVVGDGSTSLYPFAGLSNTLAAVHYIGFTSPGLVTGCTRAVEIVNNFTYSAIFVTQPPATATAGEIFSRFPVVRIQDQFGNIALEGGAHDAVVTLEGHSNNTCTNQYGVGLPGLVGVRPLTSDNGLSIQASSAETAPFELRMYRKGNLYIRASAPGVTPTCSSLVVVSPNVVDQAETLFTATSPVAANDFHSSAVQVTLRDQYRNGIQGVVPTFSTDGTNNTQTACGSSNTNGVSNCTLRSTSVELKTLSLLTPTTKTTTSNFITPPDVGTSSIVGTSPVVADGAANSTITITMLDAGSNPVVGIRPTFLATNTGNTNGYGTCSISNGSGVSTCTLNSRRAEVKTLEITMPFTMSDGTVTFEAGAVSGPNSDIVGTSPVVADDVALSTVTITLRDANNNPVAGETPTFEATDTDGTNSYFACSASDLAGSSTCTMRSQRAEVKTLELLTPANRVGGDVTFTAGAPVVANSSITGTSPVFANNSALSQIEIELFDIFMNPAVGVTPTFSATNGPNVLGGCSAADALGLSQCTMSSAVSGLKDLEVTSPVSVPGGNVFFSAAALIEKDAGSDPENYGSVAVDTTHTFTINNLAAHSSGLINVIFNPAIPPRWTLTSDTCSTISLDSADFCTLEVTFNGTAAPANTYFATVTISSAQAGDVVLNLEATKP